MLFIELPQGPALIKIHVNILVQVAVQVLVLRVSGDWTVKSHIVTSAIRSFLFYYFSLAQALHKNQEEARK